MKLIYEEIDDYIVIDLETTGLRPGHNEIIEVSCIKVQNNKISDKLCTLVKPNKEIPTFITELTGIDNEMVENAPKIESLIEEIDNFIDGFPILGQNINFDISFLKQHLHNDFVEVNYIDTMFLGRKFLKELNHHRLDDFIHHFDIDMKNRHRAEDDCLATIEVYNHFKPIMRKHNGKNH